MHVIDLIEITLLVLQFATLGVVLWLTWMIRSWVRSQSSFQSNKTEVVTPSPLRMFKSSSPSSLTERLGVDYESSESGLSEAEEDERQWKLEFAREKGEKVFGSK